jgi:GH3 auxin-responsive promoter
MIQSGESKSYHEWFVEFEHEPENLSAFALKVDNNLRDKNIYYDDLIRGNILNPLVIRPLRKNAFIGYMKSIGKLGGQNKVPRLSNDRNLAEALKPYAVLD